MWCFNSVVNKIANYCSSFLLFDVVNVFCSLKEEEKENEFYFDLKCKENLLHKIFSFAKKNIL